MNFLRQSLVAPGFIGLKSVEAVTKGLIAFEFHEHFSVQCSSGID